MRHMPFSIGIKERDQWADENLVATDAWDTSVKTGRDLEHIETEGETYKRGKAYSTTSRMKAKPRKTSAPKTATAKRKGAAKTSPAKKQPPKGKPRRRGPRAEPAFVAPQLATLDSSPPPGAGATNGNLDELPVHIQVANRVTRLIPLLRDETITPQQFAVLVSDMPGCSEAFGEAAES